MDRNFSVQQNHSIRRFGLTGLAVIVAIGICGIPSAFGQNDTESSSEALVNPFELSLEQALNVPITITSKGAKQLSVRQAAGSVIVIDSKAIEDSGAQNLWELLSLVPGFQMAGDVNGTFGIAFRGLPNVGRILLRIDGQEMSEHLFQTIPKIEHYSKADIERIEIIRGPGSVLYGGAAEYAVIEVTTKKPSKANEGMAVAYSGVTTEGISRYGGTVWQSIGDKDQHLTLAATGGDAETGSGDYHDLYGNSFEMKDNQGHRLNMLNVGGRSGDLSVRYIRDHYYDREQDQYGIISPMSTKDYFEMDRLELKYSPTFSSELSGQFYLNYAYDQTYKATDDDIRDLETSDPSNFGGLWFNQHLTRYTATGELNYHPSEIFSVLVGTSAFTDKGRGFLISGERSPEYDATNAALYGEMTISPSFATLIAGTRYEHSDAYDSALVSRVALTKMEKRWHAKLQHAQSFRAPGFQNVIAAYPDPLETDPRIEPETTTVSEIEAGHAFGENFYFTGTLFNVETDNTITYFFDPQNTDLFGYANREALSSKGVETTLMYQFERGNVGLSYWYYRTDDVNPVYAVINTQGEIMDSAQLAGFSNHVGAVTTTVKLNSTFTFNSALQIIGRRYENSAVTPEGGLVMNSIDSQLPWRATLTAHDVGIKNFDLQFTVNNVLNQRLTMPQDSPDYHGTIPRLRREALLTAILKW